jgi:hypothetical protein
MGVSVVGRDRVVRALMAAVPGMSREVAEIRTDCALEMCVRPVPDSEYREGCAARGREAEKESHFDYNDF